MLQVLGLQNQTIRTPLYVYANIARFLPRLLSSFDRTSP